MLSALVSGTVAWATDQPPAADQAKGLLVKGNTEFAFDLYARLREQEGNLFLSPYSISSALGMTYLGARGDTAAQMAKTLHFMDQNGLPAAFEALRRELHGADKDRKYQLHVANALWGQKGHPFLRHFLHQTNQYFGAGLREVDFVHAAEEARREINAWVEKQTQDKIKDLLKPGVLTSNDRLVLTNAIYFKAAWQQPFSKAATKKEDFLLAGGGKAGVDMMHQTEEYRYLDGGSFQAVDLPYEGNDLSMVVFLPKKADGLAELEKSLTGAKLAEWLPKMKHAHVALALPKFKTTAEFELSKVLAAMGMPDAFAAGKADFSGMDGTRELFISRVVHKAFVDVDEKGTEAAAATAVIMKRESAPVSPVSFRADHPFVFLIRDNRTGSVLFLGRLADPRAS
jgi:serpin B